MRAFFEQVRALLLSWGPLGLFVATLVDGAGLPNPSGPDILLLLYATAAPDQAYWGAAAALAGSMIGSYILFRISQKGGEVLLRKHTESPRGRHFRRWFNRYGLVTVFVPAVVPMVPLPLKVFVVCSGALGIRPVTFLATIAAGRIPRYIGMAYLGERLGTNSVGWLKDHAKEFGLLGLGLLVFIFLLMKVVERIRHVPEEA
jgi:membrane protein YqaA with SNARE-associated domain